MWLQTPPPLSPEPHRPKCNGHSVRPSVLSICESPRKLRRSANLPTQSAPTLSRAVPFRAGTKASVRCSFGASLFLFEAGDHLANLRQFLFRRRLGTESAHHQLL